MPAKIKKGVYEHRFAVFFFAFLVLYNFIIVTQCQLWQADRITYDFHLVDFSMGFCTKFLVGSVFNLLFRGHTTLQAVTAYETVLLLLFFAVLAVLLEKLMQQAARSQRKTLLILILFFLSGPFTFAMFSQRLGMLDVHWVFLTAAFVFCLSKKKLWWSLPPLLFAMVLVHYASVCSYCIFACILMVYELAGKERGNRKLWAVFVVSVVLVCGGTLYFVVQEQHNLTYSLVDFNNVLASRGSGYFEYYDNVLYHRPPNLSALELEELGNLYADGIPPDPNAPFLARMWEVLWQRIRYIFYLYNKTPGHLFRISTTVLALQLPLLYMQYRFFIGCMRRNRDALYRFALFCMLAQYPFTLVIGVCGSSDYARWGGHALLLNTALFLFMCYRERERAREYLQKIMPVVQSPATAFYLFFYALVRMDPFSS